MDKNKIVMDVMTRVLNEHKAHICKELDIKCSSIGFRCTGIRALGQITVEIKVDEVMGTKQVTLGNFKHLIVYLKAIRLHVEKLGLGEDNKLMYAMCLYVITHELRHVYQFEHEKPMFRKCLEDRFNGLFKLGTVGHGDDPMEKDANEYAKSYIKRNSTKLNYAVGCLMAILEEDAGRLKHRVFKRRIAKLKVKFLKMFSK